MSKQKKILLLAGIVCLLLLIGLLLLMLGGGEQSPAVGTETTTTGQQTIEDSTETVTDTTGSAVDTTAPVSDPTAPVSDPTTPVSDPTTPGVQPTTPAVTDPTTPVVAPTTPSVADPTTPVVAPTIPAVTDPTAPVVAPTIPAVTDPTAPVVQPTTPVTNPTEPVVTPTTPVTTPTTPVTDPTTPSTNPTTPTVPEQTVPDETTPAPSDPPPSVVIPGADEETGLQFPCQVPGYELVIEKLAPYTGLFVEDGTNTQRENVAMLLIRNDGNEPLEYAQISVTFESETLEFYLSALPAGQRAVVQERNGKSIPADKPLEASVMLVQRAEMSIASEISVKDNGDNSLTVENLTDQQIPAVRIFYKYYMENSDLYVGGIAFTVKINRLSAHGKMVIRPSHFISQTSRVVMALVYEDGE